LLWQQKRKDFASITSAPDTGRSQVSRAPVKIFFWGLAVLRDSELSHWKHNFLFAELEFLNVSKWF
jgi:hypothetical protein